MHSEKDEEGSKKQRVTWDEGKVQELRILRQVEGKTNAEVSHYFNEKYGLDLTPSRCRNVYSEKLGPRRKSLLQMNRVSLKNRISWDKDKLEELRILIEVEKRDIDSVARCFNRKYKVDMQPQSYRRKYRENFLPKPESPLEKLSDVARVSFPCLDLDEGSTSLFDKKVVAPIENRGSFQILNSGKSKRDLLKRKADVLGNVAEFTDRGIGGSLHVVEYLGSRNCLERDGGGTDYIWTVEQLRVLYEIGKRPFKMSFEKIAEFFNTKYDINITAYACEEASKICFELGGEITTEIRTQITATRKAPKLSLEV
jgi:hypothetical protein